MFQGIPAIMTSRMGPTVICGGNNIAYDANTNDLYNGSTSPHTYSFTVGSGSNRIILLAVQVSTGGTVTSASYGGVAMTLINSQSISNGFFDMVYLYYLIAPATGSNTVSISGSGFSNLYSMVTSYTGVSQTSPLDGNAVANKASGSGSSISASITTTCGNDWLVGYCTSVFATTQTAGSNTYLRATDSPGWFSTWVDTNAPDSAGSNSLTVTITSTDQLGLNIVALKSN